MAIIDKRKLLKRNQKIQEQLKAAEWANLLPYLKKDWWTPDLAGRIFTGVVHNIDLRTGYVLNGSIFEDPTAVSNANACCSKIMKHLEATTHSSDYIHPDDLEEWHQKPMQMVRFCSDYIYEWGENNLQIPWLQWANDNGHDVPPSSVALGFRVRG